MRLDILTALLITASSSLTDLLRTIGGVPIKIRDPNLLRIVILRLQQAVHEDPLKVTPKSLCLISQGLSKIIKSSQSTRASSGLISFFEQALEAMTSHASALTLTQAGDLALSCAESRILPSDSLFSLFLDIAREQLSSLASDQVTATHLSSLSNILWAVALLNPHVNDRHIEVLVGLVGIIVCSLSHSLDLITPSLASRLVFTLGIISACHHQHQKLLSTVKASSFTQLMMRCDSTTTGSTNSACLVVQGLLAASAATGHRADELGIRGFLQSTSQPFLQSASQPFSYEKNLEAFMITWKKAVKDSKPSGTAFKVFESLQRLKEINQSQMPYNPTMESLVGGGMFCVDILTPWPSEGEGQLQWSMVALEVDGPSHFSSNSQGVRTLGTDVARRLCIESFGLCPASVPFFEWDGLKDEVERAAYLTKTFTLCTNRCGRSGEDPGPHISH